jgi:histidinol phosphatase-like enzyme
VGVMDEAMTAMPERVAVFLDRGGTVGPTCDFSDFRWYPMAVEAVSTGKSSRLARHCADHPEPDRSWSLLDFWRHLRELEQELRVSGARLDALYCCPHDPEEASTWCGLPSITLRTTVLPEVCTHGQAGR